MNDSTEQKQPTIDFLRNADNIYRTRDYIVKQRIVLCGNGMCGRTVSEDTFYRRTPLRDSIYNRALIARGTSGSGRRMRADTYIRRYIE